MGRILFVGLMIVLSVAFIQCIIEGNYFLGIFGFIFVNAMSFTLGLEYGTGNDSEVFGKVKREEVKNEKE